MKTVKILLGSACLLTALILSIPFLMGFKFATDLPLALSNCWLAGIGWFLLARKNLPMSRTGRILCVFNGSLCLGFLFFVGIPNFIKTRSTSCCNACINNLRRIDAAANQFALENHLTNGDRINFPSDLTPYITLNREGKIPPCPQGGVYHMGKVGEAPTCSLGTTVTPAHVEP